MELFFPIRTFNDSADAERRHSDIRHSFPALLAGSTASGVPGGAATAPAVSQDLRTHSIAALRLRAREHSARLQHSIDALFA